MRRSILLLIVFLLGCSSQSGVKPCIPECRDGFTCVDGECVSPCNPPCPDGTTCNPDTLECDPVVDATEEPDAVDDPVFEPEPVDMPIEILEDPADEDIVEDSIEDPEEEDPVEEDPAPFVFCDCMNYGTFDLDRTLISCLSEYRIDTLAYACEMSGRLNLYLPEWPGDFSEYIDPAPTGRSIILDDTDSYYHVTLTMTFSDCDNFSATWTTECAPSSPCDSCGVETFTVTGTRRP